MDKVVELLLDQTHRSMSLGLFLHIFDQPLSKWTHLSLPKHLGLRSNLWGS
jgi:hypothetical protein